MKLLKFAVSAKVHQLLIGLMIISFPACSTMVLKPTDFAWPVESVLKVDEQGFIHEGRNSLTFNTKEIFFEETGDSLAYKDKEIRLIRDMNGYYYITSDNFKNAYVFKVGEGKLSLENKFLISETGITDPAFNQRQPYIELVEGNNKYLLTNDESKTENVKNESMSKREDKNEN
jgi:hypothetical protein